MIEKFVKRLAFAGTGTAIAITLSGCTLTPQILSAQELELASETVLATLDAEQETIEGPIDLYGAMARALKYNLDHRVEQFRISLAQRQASAATAQMLPELAANAGYAARSNDIVTQSQDLLTGVRTDALSTSAERRSGTADLAFTFHVLDFGLSYVRAQQAADKALIAEEQRRKILNRIVEDVRTAYWRAVSAERLLEGFRDLERRVETAQANNEKLRKAGHASPMLALTSERELVDIKKQIRRLDSQLRTAKAQLAGLMNVRPHSQFSLVVPKRNLQTLTIDASGTELARLAVRNRPEFRETLYRGRINVAEEDAAKLELLPGIQLFAGTNFDSNDYLLNSSWLDAGARASWNLMRLLKYPTRRAMVRAEGDLVEVQAKAYAMAIITQVHMARARLEQARRIAETAAEYAKVQDRITEQIRARVSAGAEARRSLIREEMNALVAAVEYDIAYADLQNAFGNVYAAVGLDPIDPATNVEARSVADLGRDLRTVWVRRGDGS